jgi:hypothetical protein
VERPAQTIRLKEQRGPLVLALGESQCFDHLMRSMGRMVEEKGRSRFYEYVVDGAFAKAKGGGAGIGFYPLGTLKTYYVRGHDTCYSLKAGRQLTAVSLRRYVYTRENSTAFPS